MNAAQSRRAGRSADYDRPVSQFEFMMSDKEEWHWQTRLFLPLFRLKWAEDMSDRLCQGCPLAAHGHPLVPSSTPHTLMKLCTLSVIQNGLLTLDEVFSMSGGCGAKDDDYIRARKMLGLK